MFAKFSSKFDRRNVVILVLVLLALYIIVPQIGRFRDSLSILRHIRVWWLVLAIGLSLITYTAAAASYYLLAKERIKYFRTVVIQGASMFANHLFPAGIGNISVNFLYLRKNKHTKIEAGSVIAVNNFIGFIGHIILLTTLLLITHTSPLHIKVPHILRDFVLVGAGIVIVFLLVCLISNSIRKRIRLAAIDARSNILSYKDQPAALFFSLICIMSLTTLYSLCLSSCAKALGIDLTLTQSLIVLTVGVAGSTLTPTPGGVIGVEAGLGAGLIACGISAAPALAIVLTYRFVTYWLAILLGLSSFLLAEKKKYI
jgi:uncharacterized membrane protein YbhN (UPF0104 family)